MADINIFSGFKRLRDFPIDPSCRYKTYAELETYVKTSRVAYAGQIVAVYDDRIRNGVYIIYNNNGKLDIYGVSSRLNEIEELLKLVEDRIDNVESDSTKTTELVNELSEKVTRIEGDFVSHDELKDAVNKILGSEELDEKLDTIDEIQKWINEHTDLLGTLSEISEKIDNVYTKAEIDAKIDAIDVSEQLKDYVKKEELEDTLKELNNIENTIKLPFKSKRSNTIIPSGAIIKQIDLVINTAAESYFIPDDGSNEFVIAQKVLDEGISDEKVLITDEDIDTEVVLDSAQLPETFRYILNYKVQNDKGVLIRVDATNFIGLEGIAYISYVR